MSPKTKFPTEIGTGWWLPGLSNDDHHNGKAITSSKLKLLVRSPGHLHPPACMLPDEPEEKTSPALEFGTKSHTAAFERDLFERLYVLGGQCEATKKSDGKRCTNDGTVRSEGAWFCGVHGKNKEAEDVEVITAKDRDACLFIADNLWSNPEIGPLLEAKDNVMEVSGEILDYAGRRLRVRPDARIRSAGVIGDLKTTGDARPEPFAKSAARLLYHLSACMYLSVSNVLDGPVYHTFTWWVAEKEPPYPVVAYDMPQEAAEKGMELYMQALELYSECEKRNDWPTYPPRDDLWWPAWSL